MSKKGNQFDIYTIGGKFKIVTKTSHVFQGEIKGIWDDALYINDDLNGDAIIFLSSIEAMIECPTETGNQKAE